MDIKKTNKIDFDKVMTVLFPLLFGGLILLLWQTEVLHRIIHADSFTLPVPGRILRILSENMSVIMVNVRATVTAASGGLILGSLLGYLLAIVATVFPKWGPGGITVVSAFNAVPIIAIAPIMTNLTKDFSRDPNARSMLAKMLVVMITCTVSMSINSFRGFTELKPFSKDLMRSIASSRKQVFCKLMIPNSVPYIFTALRVSVPASIISAMVSEYFAEYITGVGRQIRENIVLAQYSTAWAYIAAATAIGVVMYIILIITENILLKGRQ